MPVKIRNWKLSDATDLALVLSNKKIRNNLRDGLPYPYTAKDGKEYISAMLSANENKTFAFAITVDDKVIGSIGVFRQENIHKRTAELGYYIAEEYWGKSITTEAVKQISVCQKRLRLCRPHGGFHSGNASFPREPCSAERCCNRRRSLLYGTASALATAGEACYTEPFRNS